MGVEEQLAVIAKIRDEKTNPRVKWGIYQQQSDKEKFVTREFVRKVRRILDPCRMPHLLHPHHPHHPLLPP